MILIVLGDVGLAHLDCFGGLGGIVETPNTTRRQPAGQILELRYACLPTAARSACSRVGTITSTLWRGPGSGDSLPLVYSGRKPRSNGLRPRSFWIEATTPSWRGMALHAVRGAVRCGPDDPRPS